MRKFIALLAVLVVAGFATAAATASVSHPVATTTVCVAGHTTTVTGEQAEFLTWAFAHGFKVYQHTVTIWWQTYTIYTLYQGRDGIPVANGACAVPSRGEDSTFLCYSKFGVETVPGIWPLSIAKQLYAAGYWLPVAVAGNGGAAADNSVHGKYHFVCNPAAGKVDTGFRTDFSEDWFGKTVDPTLGTFAIYA